jgi:hypothetical protein
MCCALHGKAVQGAPVLPGNERVSMSSTQACCFACTNNPECKAWSFHADSKQCSLMSARGRFQDQNHSSGVLAITSGYRSGDQCTT